MRQEEAHLKIEMKLRQSLAQMGQFSSSGHTKAANIICEEFLWRNGSRLILKCKE